MDNGKHRASGVVLGDTRAAQQSLKIAVGIRSVEGVKAALAAGADPNFRDGDEDWSTLHWAAQMALSGPTERIVDLLLGAGADPNAQGRDGRRALHQAALNGCIGAAKALIKSGALIGARDAEGHSAADLARFAAQAQPGRDLKMADFLGSQAACQEAEEIERALKNPPERSRATPRV